MAKTTKEQSRRSSSRIQATDTIILRNDYGKIRPHKNEPDVVGRTRWFTERADARSVSRLRTALPDVPTSAVAISDFDSGSRMLELMPVCFSTEDGGATWTAFQDGLPRSPITELKFNRRHNRLFAATMGRGV